MFYDKGIEINGMRKGFAKASVIAAALISILMVLMTATAYADPVPSPAGEYFYDSVGVLSQETQEEITKVNKGLEKQNGSQIIVAAVKNIDGYGSMEEYALEFFEKWKPGAAGEDNGILIIAAIDDRKARIEVGYGMEGELTDAEAGRILKDTMFPAFKEGKYDEGLLHSFEKAAYYASGGKLGSESGKTEAEEVQTEEWTVPMIIAAVVFAILGIGVIVLVIVKLVGFIRDLIDIFRDGGSGGSGGSSWRDDSYSSWRSSSGSSSGSFSSGGFSGGGGSSGGGGASGGW